jgi:ABC-type iron transport system FetAB permease component
MNSNPLYWNWLEAIHNRDIVYNVLLVIVALVIVGYYVAYHLPVPSMAYRKMLVVGYWVAVALTYLTLLFAAAL